MTTVLQRRLRAHRLVAPARTIEDAAAHQLAVQAQDFAAARWALALRTRGEPGVADVDAAFDRGALVRSWTMRGTLHALPARDLAWVLSVTGERQARQAAGVHRREGIDADETARAERLVRAALGGGGRLARTELSAVLERGGVATDGQRGYHLLTALAVRGVLCLGPVVPREGALAREQLVMLCEDAVAESAGPADPLAELFARYVAAHAPATVRDFAWWSGLSLGLARQAAAAASDRVVARHDGAEPAYAPVGPLQRRAARAPRVLALGPFDEYYLSYADRATTCTSEVARAVGPGANGMVRATVVFDGRVVGVWTPSALRGRGGADAAVELLETVDATGEEIAAALARYIRFVGG